MVNFITIPANRQCPVCLQERPKGTLFLGHAPVVNEPPLAEGEERPPVPVCLIQAGEVEIDDRVHIVCEHCIWTPQSERRFPRYPELTTCPTCRRSFNIAISISSLGRHVKTVSAALFQRTVWGANYITELFKESSIVGKRVLERVQESYLRHPEKRTWIKVTLYATALLAAWTSLCVMLGVTVGLYIPLRWLVCRAMAAERLVIKVSFLALAILQSALCFSVFCSPIIPAMSRIEERVEEEEPESEPYLPILPSMSPIFTFSILMLAGSGNRRGFFNKIIPLRHVG